ncbi:MAG: hypothetical protein OEV70_05530 [Nitrospirota bacterium]|nr:hypothetical protein [Nitrospirota bacterium]
MHIVRRRDGEHPTVLVRVPAPKAGLLHVELRLLVHNGCLRHQFRPIQAGDAGRRKECRRRIVGTAGQASECGADFAHRRAWRQQRCCDPAHGNPETVSGPTLN